MVGLETLREDLEECQPRLPRRHVSGDTLLRESLCASSVLPLQEAPILEHFVAFLVVLISPLLLKLGRQHGVLPKEDLCIKHTVAHRTQSSCYNPSSFRTNFPEHCIWHCCAHPLQSSSSVRLGEAKVPAVLHTLQDAAGPGLCLISYHASEHPHFQGIFLATAN